MTVISRRDFGRALLAAVPAVSVMGTIRLDGVSPAIGVTTSSFHDLPRVPGRDNLDAVLQATRSAGAAHVELALRNVEPAPPNTAPVMGGSAAYPRRIVLTPEEVAATDGTARAELRAWRLGVKPGVVEDMRRRVASAGLALDACAVTFNDSFTDEEINAVFRQAKTLGVKTVSSPLTLAVARRLVPFAERHGVAVAIHNQVDGNAAGLVDTVHLREALAMSPLYRVRLDVGALTASNHDAVAMLREYRARAACVIVKDRLRNGGASQPPGEGDTPLAAVLHELASGPAVPALFEYHYAGLRPSIEETKLSLAYLAQIANS